MQGRGTPGVPDAVCRTLVGTLVPSPNKKSVSYKYAPMNKNEIQYGKYCLV